MSKLLDRIAVVIGLLTGGYSRDYRENKALVYEATVKNNTHINQIILTMSVASLAAMAGLNRSVFEPYPVLSFVVLSFFALTILISVINIYLVGLSLRDMQRLLNENFTKLDRLDSMVDKIRYKTANRILNALVFWSFCVGVVCLLSLLGVYILVG